MGGEEAEKYSVKITGQLSQEEILLESIIITNFFIQSNLTAQITERGGENWGTNSSIFRILASVSLASNLLFTTGIGSPL